MVREGVFSDGLDDKCIRNFSGPGFFFGNVSRKKFLQKKIKKNSEEVLETILQKNVKNIPVKTFSEIPVKKFQENFPEEIFLYTNSS